LDETAPEISSLTESSIFFEPNSKPYGLAVAVAPLYGDDLKDKIFYIEYKKDTDSYTMSDESSFFDLTDLSGDSLK